MKQNRQTTAGAGVKGVGFIFNKEAQRHNSGVRTATALAKSIASPKILGLFDGEEIAERNLELTDNAKQILLTRKGKPVSLTPKQRQLVNILSDYLDRDSGQDIQNFIGWSEKVEEYGLQAAGEAPAPIARTIHLKDIVKDMYGRSKKEQIVKLRKEMDALINTTQVMVLGKQQIRVEASIIMRDISIRDDSPEERGLDFYRIVYGSVFLWNKNKRFGVRPDNLYIEWNKKGSILNTEIGSVLYSTIQAILWSYWRAADKARIAVAAEAKKNKLTPEQRKQAEAERVLNALSYEENVSTIKKRLETDYDSTKQYKAKFKTDINKVFDMLKTLGMITDGYLVKAPKGQDKAIFVISEQLREKTKGERLLPKPESTDEEKEDLQQ